VLPSDPLTVTCVAFVAVIVRVEELPGRMEDGAAVIVTVGISADADTVTATVAVADPPLPEAVAV
jgi:hypothetical protein